NDNPIHVEFGTGKGKFITTLAKQNPDINYIAMELKEEVLLKAKKVDPYISSVQNLEKKIDEDSFAVSNLEKKLAILNQELEVT
ncbi:hypothetical protein ACTPEM_26420, partial [Clostridioides difficile]